MARYYRRRRASAAQTVNAVIAWAWIGTALFFAAALAG